MIWNDPMMRRSKPPTPPEPVKPATCGTVSTDSRIQAGAEALFASGQGWFEPGTYRGNSWFTITEMVPSNGTALPSDFTYPWSYADDGACADITFCLSAPEFSESEHGEQYFPPFIACVGREYPDVGETRMYLHNLAFRGFLSDEMMDLYLPGTVVGFDPDYLYGNFTGTFLICDFVDSDGTVTSFLLQASCVYGELVVTMTEEVRRFAREKDVNYLGFRECHIGYVDE